MARRRKLSARARFAASQARTRARTGRASKFEHAMVCAMRAKLPATAALREQFPVPTGGHPYRIDAVVEHPAGFRFALEWDGPGHYDGFTGLRLREPAEQFARDRFVEDYCLREGMCLFRVPYTYAKRPRKAAAYCVAAALRDHLAGRVRVHYLDYMAAYVKINTYARAVPGVRRLLTEPDATFPHVNTRGI